MVNNIIPFKSKTCNPLLPGLEVYKTINYAKKNEKDIVYAERALDKSTINAMKVEKWMGVFHILWRTIFAKSGV